MTRSRSEVSLANDLLEERVRDGLEYLVHLDGKGTQGTAEV